MASIFLINDNKIVSRLLQLSSDKHGYLLEEKLEPTPTKKHYDIALIDSDKYTQNILEELRKKASFDKVGYIGIKKEPVPEGFDINLDKPFLPSDFVAMIEANISSSQNKTVSQQPEEEEISQDNENLEEEEQKSDESVDELLESDDENIDEILEDELEELNELDELDDLELEEETTPKAGEKEPEQTALKEIDKTEDALKELDELDEELENVDLSLDSSAIMSTGVAEQFVQEQNDDGSLEEISKTDQPQKPDIDEPKERQDENSNIKLAAAAAAGAALMTEKEQILQEITPEEKIDRSSLDALEGIEDIEKESDYIAKEEIEESVNDFESLDEKDIQQALNPQSETKDEEIIKEDIITEGSETIVETNDVQQWIQDAVAKAITPQMIKEALNDMKINITLDFTKKES